MAIDVLDELARLVEAQRETLLACWRTKVRTITAARKLDTPTLTDHIPRLLDELIVALRAESDESIAAVVHNGSSPAHGVQRLQNAFDIEEVVAEYNILRDCLHDLADEAGLSLQGKPFHVLHRVLDAAIGLAVQAFATQQALEVRHRREEYLSFVAHDLRTPLNAISLAAQVLEMILSDDRPDVRETGQMVKTLKRNVQHLDLLARKIMDENTNLDTEIGVKLERRDFDLWPLVESLIHDLHPVAGTSSTRLINAVPEDLVVYADAHLMRRVFQNLIANAIAYTPSGEVFIEARTLDDKGAVECAVRDNGDGIPAERCEVVFEKHETDPEKDGMGLGLAIVKTFVEAHGGTVTVESKLGDGSSFRFNLPGRSR